MLEDFHHEANPNLECVGFELLNAEMQVTRANTCIWA